MTIQNNFETISYSLNEQVGTITINRPKQLNALNSSVLYELKTLLEQLSKIDFQEIKALILTGEGDKAFIAGADIKEMEEMTVKQAQVFGQLGQDVTFLFEEIKIPTIACVNGFALGGGCEMALACDIIFATKNAIFGQPEVKLGLIPGFGGTQRLSKRVGTQFSKELIFTGRNVAVEEAKQIGLIHSYFETKEQMFTEAHKVIAQILVNSPFAIQKSKEVINNAVHLNSRDGLAEELKLFSEIFSSADKVEGCSAFVEKRKPQFTGK